MGKVTTDFPHPPTWINGFIKAELEKYDDIGVSSGQTLGPIFAVGSGTNIDELYNNLLQSGQVTEPLMILYDRLMVFRPNTFYPHKREQLIYYIYGTQTSNVYNAATIISQLLDREDASAQDLNEWAHKNKGDKKYNVFFHNTKVYQVQESKDLIDYATANVLIQNKLIIEYDWHSRPNLLLNGSLDPDNNYT